MGKQNNQESKRNHKTHGEYLRRLLIKDFEKKEKRQNRRRKT
jgi:hypothetical protein